MAICVEASSLEEVVDRGKNCLLIKLLTSRLYNHEAFKNTMHKIWKPVKPIKFHETGAGMMLVEFDDKLDKDWVLQNAPWNFDRLQTLLLSWPIISWLLQNPSSSSKNIGIFQSIKYIYIYIKNDKPHTLYQWFLK